MKVNFRAFALLFFLSVIFFSAFSTAAPIPLSLTQAVERMMEHNLNVRNLKLTLEQAELQYDIAWTQFYMPSISLSAGSSSAYSVGSAPFTSARDNFSSIRSRGYPTTNVTLSLGTYTLFNSFQDRFAYDSAKLSYEIAQLNYRQQLRSQKFSVTSQYFSTKTSQEKLEAAERSVAIAQAINDLVESRKRINKATEDELNSSAVDLNNAKQAYFLQRKSFTQTLINFNATLNVTPETEFKLTTAPVFIPIHLDEKELYELFKSQSPTAKQAEYSLLSSEYQVANAEKSRLPSPSVNFSGLNVTYSSGFGGGANPLYGTTSSGMMDVSLSISLIIPIYGPNGFLNSRLVKNAYLSREQSENSQKLTMIGAESNIRSQIAGIRQQEDNVKTARETFSRNSKILDSTFKKMAGSITDRLQLRDALLQARQSELEYLDSVLYHIQAKNSLAEFVGVDRLPGDQL